MVDTTDGIGRVPRHRDDRDAQSADAARSHRTPPERKPKREFDRVMRDSKKGGHVPPKKDKADAEKKGPSLFELSGKDAARAARDAFSSKTTKKKGEFEAPDEAKGDGVDGDETQKNAQAQLLASSKKDATDTNLDSSQSDIEDDAGQAAKQGLVGKERLASEEKAKATIAGLNVEGGNAAAFKAAEGSAAAQSDLKAIVKQVAEAMAVMRSSDKLETLITLKHPPLFEGATVKLTEHATAKGEFNITFSNLNRDAKALVDNMQNQDALKHALTGKGFTLHVLQTTEQKDEVIAQMEASFRRQERDPQDEGEQERQQEEQDET